MVGIRFIVLYCTWMHRALAHLVVRSSFRRDIIAWSIAWLLRTIEVDTDRAPVLTACGAVVIERGDTEVVNHVFD